MAISNVALQDEIGRGPGQPTFKDVVTLDLDGAYPAGGYATFNASVAPTIGAAKTILAVVQNWTTGGAAQAVLAQYDRVADKLVMISPLTGVEHLPGANLAAVVGLELTIISK
jgi:hypothetical protein